jgi:hypothetical protein
MRALKQSDCVATVTPDLRTSLSVAHATIASSRTRTSASFRTSSAMRDKGLFLCFNSVHFMKRNPRVAWRASTPKRTVSLVRRCDPHSLNDSAATGKGNTTRTATHRLPCFNSISVTVRPTAPTGPAAPGNQNCICDVSFLCLTRRVRVWTERWEKIPQPSGGYASRAV